MRTRTRATLAHFLAAFFLLNLSSVLAAQQQQESRVASPRRNDDYCDDPITGSDEDGTAACTARLAAPFACPYGKTITHSKVNDGVCDCCDGSDEPDVKCANTCEVLEREIRERREREEDVRRRGEAGFLDMAKEARKLLQKDKGCTGVDDEVHDPETLRLNEERQLKLTELRAALAAARDETTRLTAALAERAPEERSALTRLRVEALRLTELSIEALRNLVVELTASNSGDGPSTVKQLVRSALGLKSDQDAYGEVAEEEEDESPDAPKWVEEDQVGLAAELKAAKEAEQVAEKALNELTGSEEKVDHEKLARLAKLNFGPGDVYRTLVDQCFKHHQGEYEYSACPFDVVKQNSNVLGRYESVDYAKGLMTFERGDHCHALNGPRSFVLELICHPTTELLEISEPSICTYRGKLGTPAACVPESHRDQPPLDVCMKPA